MLVVVPFWLLLASLFLLGAIWGSFVSALCSRWPKGESVSTGRSRCDECGQQIAAYDLVPVISFAILKGRCRFCGGKISPVSPVIEMFAATIGILPLLLLPAEQAIAVAIFGWLLLPLIVLDYLYLWLPNRLILILAVAGVFAGLLLSSELTFADRLCGMSVGFILLEAVRYGYKKIRNREGMGAGDPKIFGAIGIWLGWQALPATLLVACAIGLVAAIAQANASRNYRSEFPFGSYLGAAAYVVALSQ
jgi:leader peptidase (prepilin peptidase) / N-methyltransferase